LKFCFGMRNGYLIIYLACFIGCTACNPFKSKNIEEEIVGDSSAILKDSLELLSDTLGGITDDDSNERQSNDAAILEGKLVMPLTYRFLNDDDRISKLLNPTWLAIYKEKGAYYIGNVPYRISEEAEEPCSGLPTETIEPDKNVLTYVAPKSLKTGLVDSIAINERVIQPESPFKFSYNGHVYELKANGKYFRDVDDTSSERYSLNLYKDGKYVRNLINQSEYNDTFTEIKLMADFDGDKEPDFLISSPRHYEEARYLLIFSGQHDVFEGNMVFDC